MSLEEERMGAKFRPVFRELKSIERKIYKKEGWFFVEHVYTIEELLDSKHHHKINSYTEKIGDDIQIWFDEGKLGEVEEEYYYLKRNEVEDDLEDINAQIEERERTWWEEVKDVMRDYVRVIMDNMPDEFKRKLIESLRNKNLLGKVLEWFGSGETQKQLPK